MEVVDVVKRVQRVAAVRADADGPVEVAQSALVDVRDLRAYLDASEADLVRRVAAGSSFPEASISEPSRASLGEAAKTIDRAETLDATPALAGALDDGEITSGHVDAVTRAGKGLDPDQRERLLERVDELVDAAKTDTIAQFGKRVRREAKQIAADDGIDRLERQRRQTSLSTWVDDDGMWNLQGRFDPVTGLTLAARLDAAVETLFAEKEPDSCPSDPALKQRHLRALALVRMMEDGASVGAGRPGRPEFVAVIDVAAGPGDGSEPVGGGLEVEWPIPIEVPHRVLVDLLGDADLNTVVVRNGVVLHAPGELNLGRSTRLANRSQRRALRGLYRSCAIPGCTVGFDRCKLHHIIWWRHGGRTDLENLIPVCSHHHHKIHDAGWNIELGPNRELTLTLPDGRIHNTGPPSRRAA